MVGVNAWPFPATSGSSLSRQAAGNANADVTFTPPPGRSAGASHSEILIHNLGPPRHTHGPDLTSLLLQAPTARASGPSLLHHATARGVMGFVACIGNSTQPRTTNQLPNPRVRIDQPIHHYSTAAAVQHGLLAAGTQRPMRLSRVLALYPQAQCACRSNLSVITGDEAPPRPRASS